MIIEKHMLTNHSLFELEKASELGIPDDVVAFLSRFEYPWQALGKPLAEFVKSCVDAVPTKDRHRGSISSHAFLENPESIVVSEGAVIEAGAFVTGPTFLAPGAVVRHGAYVRGSVYVCSKAVVGHTSELKGALLLPLAKAAHFAYVGDSILGVDTNLGAGTKLANLRFDHGLVNVRVGNEVLETGLKKFGAIFGNYSQSGCNSVTNPGTVLLPRAFILPTTTGRGIVRARG